jgi:hypothetical protein
MHEQVEDCSKLFHAAKTVRWQKATESQILIESRNMPRTLPRLITPTLLLFFKRRQFFGLLELPRVHWWEVGRSISEWE